LARRRYFWLKRQSFRPASAQIWQNDCHFGFPARGFGKTTVFSGCRRADLAKRRSFRAAGARIWQNDGRFGLPAGRFAKTTVVLGYRRAAEAGKPSKTVVVRFFPGF